MGHITYIIIMLLSLKKRHVPDELYSDIITYFLLYNECLKNVSVEMYHISL